MSTNLEALLGQLLQPTKHKVFISFYHYDDQRYRDSFERAFSHLFIIKSVQDGDINTDNSAEYIKRLIQQDYISDSSVCLVLVGTNTWKRKHVDWEISAALNKKVGGHSGLAGILLPEFPLLPDNTYHPSNLPARLYDNAHSNYAKLYKWDWAIESEYNVKSIIETAFKGREMASVLSKNDRLQKQRNS